jgi:RNA polymerase sigma factor (sigma-70 family)
MPAPFAEFAAEFWETAPKQTTWFKKHFSCFKQTAGHSTAPKGRHAFGFCKWLMVAPSPDVVTWLRATFTHGSTSTMPRSIWLIRDQRPTRSGSQLRADWENGRLQRGFETLSENQRQTLSLFFIEGYTFDEIAAQLGQSRGNVKHHYFRGLEKLRKELFDGELPGERPKWKAVWQKVACSLGARALSPTEPHDEFLELCAISTSEELTEEEQERLEELGGESQNDPTGKGWLHDLRPKPIVSCLPTGSYSHSWTKGRLTFPIRSLMSDRGVIMQRSLRQPRPSIDKA